MEPKKKVKMLNDASSDEDEGARSGGGVDWDKLGLEIRLMNRRTG
jgi:hypothetical protein